jgi:hypothetical protein
MRVGQAFKNGFWCTLTTLLSEERRIVKDGRTAGWKKACMFGLWLMQPRITEQRRFSGAPQNL